MRVQVQKLNEDCLALKPSQAETDKMQADIKRICKEAMVLPGQRLPASGSFDLDTEVGISQWSLVHAFLLGYSAQRSCYRMKRGIVQS